MNAATEGSHSACCRNRGSYTIYHFPTFGVLDPGPFQRLLRTCLSGIKVLTLDTGMRQQLPGHRHVHLCSCLTDFPKRNVNSHFEPLGPVCPVDPWTQGLQVGLCSKVLSCCWSTNAVHISQILLDYFYFFIWGQNLTPAVLVSKETPCCWKAVRELSEWETLFKKEKYSFWLLVNKVLYFPTTGLCLLPPSPPWFNTNSETKQNLKQLVFAF